MSHNVRVVGDQVSKPMFVAVDAGIRQLRSRFTATEAVLLPSRFSWWVKS
jgi:hypothetical protein